MPWKSRLNWMWQRKKHLTYHVNALRGIERKKSKALWFPSSNWVGNPVYSLLRNSVEKKKKKSAGWYKRDECTCVCTLTFSVCTRESEGRSSHKSHGCMYLVIDCEIHHRLAEFHQALTGFKGSGGAPAHVLHTLRVINGTSFSSDGPGRVPLRRKRPTSSCKVLNIERSLKSRWRGPGGDVPIWQGLKVSLSHTL